MLLSSRIAHKDIIPYMPGNPVHICVVKAKLEPISTGTILDLCDVNS